MPQAWNLRAVSMRSIRYRAMPVIQVDRKRLSGAQSSAIDSKQT
jgi:hypothetical protein